MDKFNATGRMVSALLRAVIPAALGALGALVATMAPVQFAAFCNGVL